VLQKPGFPLRSGPREKFLKELLAPWHSQKEVKMVPHHYEILHFNTEKAFHPPHQLPKSLLLDIAEEQFAPGNSRDRMGVTIPVFKDQAPPLPLPEMGRFQGNPTHHRPGKTIGLLKIRQLSFRLFFLFLHTLE
jgi:hypothetical protein